MRRASPACDGNPSRIRTVSSPQGMHNLAVGKAHGPPPEGASRSRPSATERSGPQGGSEAAGKRPTLKALHPEAEGLQPFQGWGEGEGL